MQEITTNNSPFDVSTTDMPTFDDMIKNPEYFREKKRREFEIVWMEPTKYIQLVATGFGNTTDAIRDGREEHRVIEYSNIMKSGGKFPMPVLDYTNDYFSQEGIHRAMAAEIANVSRIPVMVVKTA